MCKKKEKKKKKMGVDLRQIVAGILTITMFVMLGQMLHRDYFDAVQVLKTHHVPVSDWAQFKWGSDRIVFCL